MPFFHILIATCTCASEDDPHPSSDDSIELWTSDNCISVSMLAPAWGDEKRKKNKTNDKKIITKKYVNTLKCGFFLPVAQHRLNYLCP